MIVTAAQILADIAASGGDVPDEVPQPRPTNQASQVRELAECGLTDALIARRIGCSRSAVQQLRRRHGIPSGQSVLRAGDR